jgi:LuxR family transcriptional regulator, maltose regulon positive regulatory protein
MDGRFGREYILIDHVPKLTERETQVLTGLAHGLTYKQIGAELGISAGTIKVFASMARRKMGVKTTYELLAKAIGAGVIAPSHTE